MQKDETYVLLVLFVTHFTLFFVHFASLKTLLPFLGLVAVLLQAKIKNITVVLFLLTLFTIPFYQPNKYYTQTVIPAFKLEIEFKDDYYITYGINQHTIFLYLTLIAAARSYLKRKQSQRFPRKLLWPIITGGGIFTWAALASSIRYSPYVYVSAVLLTHYLDTFFVAVLVIFIFVYFKNKFPLIYPAVLASLIFQIFLSLVQFLKQSDAGTSVELVLGRNPFYQGLDEITTLYRVSGTAQNPNQFGFLIVILLTILTFFYTRKNLRIGLGIVLSGIVAIILSQSRSVWIGMGLFLVTFCYFAVNALKRLAQEMSVKKLLLYLALFLIVLAPILIPRMLLLSNSFSQGAGFSYRVDSFKEAGEAFWQSPWIGYGIGTNEYVIFSLFPNGTQSVFPTAVHNGFLEMLLEVGIVGIAGFLFPFFYILRFYVNSRNTVSPRSHIFMFTFIAGSLVSFVYFLFQPYGILEFPYLGIILGMGFVGIINTYAAVT